jgi:spoIIIJ-associated protein
MTESTDALPVVDEELPEVEGPTTEQDAAEAAGPAANGAAPTGNGSTADAVDAAAEDVGSAVDDARPAGESRHDLLVAEGDAAGDYLERLLDILDYDGDIDLDVEGERAVVSIIGTGDVERLIGDHGEVLEALQELSRLAATTETGQRSRLMLDIAGYRSRRRDELAELGRETARQVLQTGEPIKLGVMNPFERKVVHDAVGTVGGVTSSSEGEEPHRRVVVTLAS